MAFLCVTARLCLHLLLRCGWWIPWYQQVMNCYCSTFADFLAVVYADLRTVKVARCRFRLFQPVGWRGCVRTASALVYIA